MPHPPCQKVTNTYVNLIIPSHINIVKSSHYHMQTLRLIHLDRETEIVFANAIVGRIIDNCYSLLHCVSSSSNEHCNSLSSETSNLVRVCFKNDLITSKAVTYYQPPSLWKRHKIRDVPHNLHSSRSSILTSPYSKGFADHAYSYHARRL